MLTASAVINQVEAHSILTALGSLGSLLARANGATHAAVPKVTSRQHSEGSLACPAGGGGDYADATSPTRPVLFAWQLFNQLKRTTVMARVTGYTPHENPRGVRQRPGEVKGKPRIMYSFRLSQTFPVRLRMYPTSTSPDTIRSTCQQFGLKTTNSLQELAGRLYSRERPRHAQEFHLRGRQSRQRCLAGEGSTGYATIPCFAARRTHRSHSRAEPGWAAKIRQVGSTTTANDPTEEGGYVWTRPWAVGVCKLLFVGRHPAGDPARRRLLRKANTSGIMREA